MARTKVDDKEKYQAYLCSREWAEKREAVRARAFNRCERCKVLPMEACHHLTYARKYNEKLEDLQAICNACHQFTHGKSEFDPLSFDRFLDFVGRWPVRSIGDLRLDLSTWCLHARMFPHSLAIPNSNAFAMNRAFDTFRNLSREVRHGPHGDDLSQYHQSMDDHIDAIIDQTTYDVDAFAMYLKWFSWWCPTVPAFSEEWVSYVGFEYLEDGANG